MRWPWARDDDAAEDERRARRDLALTRLENLVTRMQVTVERMQAIEAREAQRGTDA